VVDLVEVLDHALLDVSAALAKATGNVRDDILSVLIAKDLSKELTRLLVVVVGVGKLVTASDSSHGVLSLGVALVLDGAVQGVRLPVSAAALVSVDSHGSITLVVVNASAVRAVDGDLVVVGAEAVSLGIGVVQESALEHLVEGGLNSGNHVGGGESDLLSFGVEVFLVAVEDELTDGNERVVAVGPDLGDVVHVVSVLVSVSNRHELDEEGPGAFFAGSDVLEKIVGGEVLVLDTHIGGLLCGEVLDARVGLEVVLDEELLVLLVDPLEGVGAVSVHVTETVGGASVGEENRDLVEGLGGEGPEVEGVVGVLGTGVGVSLLGVDEVGELNGVFDEENGSVVSNDVVVSFLSVELHGEATGVTVAVVGTALTSDSRESQEKRSLLADLVEELGLGEAGQKKNKVNNLLTAQLRRLKVCQFSLSNLN